MGSRAAVFALVGGCSARLGTERQGYGTVGPCGDGGVRPHVSLVFSGWFGSLWARGPVWPLGEVAWWSPSWFGSSRLAVRECASLVFVLVFMVQPFMVDLVVVVGWQVACREWLHLCISWAAVWFRLLVSMINGQDCLPVKWRRRPIGIVKLRETACWREVSTLLHCVDSMFTFFVLKMRINVLNRGGGRGCLYDRYMLANVSNDVTTYPPPPLSIC